MGTLLNIAGQILRMLLGWYVQRTVAIMRKIEASTESTDVARRAEITEMWAFVKSQESGLAEMGNTVRRALEESAIGAAMVAEQEAELQALRTANRDLDRKLGI